MTTHADRFAAARVLAEAEGTNYASLTAEQRIALAERAANSPAPGTRSRANVAENVPARELLVGDVALIGGRHSVVQSVEPDFHHEDGTAFTRIVAVASGVRHRRVYPSAAVVTRWPERRVRSELREAEEDTTAIARVMELLADDEDNEATLRVLRSLHGRRSTAWLELRAELQRTAGR